MTLQEFINTRPQSYGTGNINLLYSSSISGSEDTPIPPFILQGVTIPFVSQEGVDVTAALKEVDQFKFGFTSGSVTATITGRQKKTEYFYYTFENLVLDYLPTTIDAAGNNNYSDSEFVFIPYTTLAFNNNDYNPLINNSQGSKRNSRVRKVDRFSSQNIPTNLTSIILNTAELAELQNCSYTKRGLLNGRYNGTKTSAAGSLTVYNKQLLTTQITTKTIPGNEPALSFRELKGSVHPNDSDIATIKAINQSDREVLTIYFNAELTGTHPNKSYPNFPSVGSYIYIEDANRLIKVVNSKIYSIDKGTVYTTTELGAVSSIG